MKLRITFKKIESDEIVATLTIDKQFAAKIENHIFWILQRQDCTTVVDVEEENMESKAKILEDCPF